MRIISKETKAIADKASKKKGRMNQRVPAGIFAAALMFVLAFMCAMISVVSPWLKYFYKGDEVNRIIVVNAEHDFKQFCYDNGLTGNIIYKDWDAEYDYVTYGDWMRKNYAFLTIVFSRGYEDALVDPTLPSPEILTYYRTNSLEYTEWKNNAIDYVISRYEDYVKESRGIESPTNENLVIKHEEMYREVTNWGKAIVKGLTSTVFPLVLFIILLYVSMSTGTDVLAGEKERGTFSAILLSPIPRRSIIAGNILGTCRKAFIPALITYIVMTICSVPYSLSLYGIIIGILLLLSLCVFIAAITIAISALNHTVVSAQTAFLPVFLVMVAVCVTCIQGYEDPPLYYFFIPVYGHFYGIGLALMGEPSIIGAVACIAVTSLITAAIVYAAVKIIKSERFTSGSGAVTDKEIRKAKKLLEKKQNDYVSKPRYALWGYKPRKRSSALGFIIDQIMYPLAILSVFQLLALIPTAIAYMRKPEYSAFIAALKDVDGIPGIIDKTMEVMAIFMGDPLFLVLMSIGYIMIIVCYLIRNKFRDKSLPSAMGFSFHGLKNTVGKYCKGMLLGFVLMSSVFGILVATGQIKPSVNTLSAGGIFTIITSVIMWLPQGAAEEVMFRGFMLPRQSSRFGLGFAVVFSSLLFAGFHSMNVGFSWLAFVNLFLIAAFFALIDIRAGHIWYSCAAHSVWNFLQGNIYGLEVSGNQSAASIIRAGYTSNASSSITGGSFGPEGGLAVTAVTVVAIVIVLILNRRTRGRSQQSPS